MNTMNPNNIPEERKAILQKIWKLHQRVQKWITAKPGTRSPSEMNVAQAVLRELEEYTIAIGVKGDYRLSKHDMKSVNSYWKAYR